MPPPSALAVFPETVLLSKSRLAPVPLNSMPPPWAVLLLAIVLLRMVSRPALAALTLTPPPRVVAVFAVISTFVRVSALSVSEMPPPVVVLPPVSFTLLMLTFRIPVPFRVKTLNAGAVGSR